jgi:hypothetical protein
MPLGEISRLLYALQEMAQLFSNFAAATARDSHLQPTMMAQNGGRHISSSNFTFRVCELDLEPTPPGHV